MKILLAAFIALTITSCHSVADDPKPFGGPEPSWALSDFVKADEVNPILAADTSSRFTCAVTKENIQWEAAMVLNPTAIVKDNKIYLLYRAQDKNKISRIGLATSEDGLHFTKESEPVFYPGNDSMEKYEANGGVEDPRIVEAEDGSYILTYTAYDGKTARLCLATSRDLKHWEKQGVVLNDAKYRNTGSRSGAIIVRAEGNRMIAAKIKGKYWMYFGDTDLFIACSSDLIHWSAAEDKESGKMISVLHPRPGHFDSRRVEPGPYALLRNDNILLIYNGSNASNFNDVTIPAFTYSAGQAIFNKNNPYRLIGRAENSFIQPDKPYERSGEVKDICFVEGLVYFKGKWFLYYGAADSGIAVAVRDQP